MTLTPEQLKAGIEFFQILANIQRRLQLEEREKMKIQKDKETNK